MKEEDDPCCQAYWNIKEEYRDAIEQRDELLAALKEIYEWTVYKDTSWAKRAYAAIAKAEGNR